MPSTSTTNSKTNSPTTKQRSLSISFNVSPKEIETANACMDSLNQLILEFGKGIDKKKYGNNVTRYDVSKKALLLLSSLDNHLSTIVGKEKSTIATDKFDFAKIESVLFKAILSYATPADVLAIRRTICSCLKKMYSVENQMIAKASSRLVVALENHANLVREANSFPQIVSLIYCIETLASIASHLLPPFANVLPILHKLWKLQCDSIKVAILVLVGSYVGSNSKRFATEWSEYIKMAQRGQIERSSEVRNAAGNLCLSIASAMTPELAQNKVYDAFLAFCAKSMDDTDLKVRASFASAAAEALYRVITPDDVRQESGKPLAKTYTCGFSLILLTSPFSKIGASKELREAICISVIRFLNRCTNEMLEMNIEIVVSNLIGLLGNTKAYVTSGDLLQAQMYVSQMIRMGIVHKLDESGRVTALKELIRILDRYSSNQHAMICLIQEIAALINVLGEIIGGIRDQILESILICLRHSSDYVRYAGALCTRTLAAAIPAHTTSLISALMNMVQIDHAELAMCTKAEEQQLFANSLHGHSNALAALIFISTKHTLAASHVLCSAALDTAILLGKQNTFMSAYVATKRQEACWVLICAILSLNDYWVKMNMEKLTELWDQAMESKLTKLPTEDELLTSTLRSKAAALLSLSMFMHSCPTLMTKDMTNQLYGYFVNVIRLLSTLPSNYKPGSSASLYAINLIKLYLFELIRKFPPSIFEKGNQKNVIKFITKLAFAEIDGTHNGVETSLLHTFILADSKKEHYNDMHAMDLFELLLEDELQYFSKSGRLYFFSQEHPQFQEFTIEPDSSCILDDSKQSFFEKPLSLNVRLVDSAIKLLGVLFTYHKHSSRNQIIQYFVSHIKAVFAVPEDLRLSNTVFSNVIASIYFILEQIKQKNRKSSEAEKSYFANINNILNAGLGHESESIRRGASRTLAILANLIGAPLMEDLLKRCATKIVKEGPSKSGYALALGDVNSSLGSLTTRNHLPQTVSFLLALASRSNSINTQICAFQSIWNTIETSGIGFSAHVDSILQNLLGLYLSPVGTLTDQKLNQDDDKHLLLGCTRILYAFIALGPDIIFRPNFADVFNLLMRDILSSKIIPVQAEATKLIERTVLLASVLIPNLKGVIMELRRFLLNAPSDSSLKRIVSHCLKIISEKELDIIFEIFPPRLLFKVLDQFNYEVESEEHGGGNHIKEIISLMIQSKNAQCPLKHWVLLINDIISSEPRRLIDREDIGGMVADTDDAERYEQESRTSNDSFSWQVKAFAMECLKQLLETYKDVSNLPDRKNTNVLPEQNDSIITYIPQITSICSIALSKGTFSIKHASLLLFNTILKLFQDVPDPQMPEESVLQQNSVRFSAAIAQGFESKNPPILTYAACSLAASYIPSKLLLNQPNQISRMCSYLTDQLPKLTDLSSSNYGEIAATMIKFAILSSLADIYNAADDKSHADLLTVLEPHMQLLFNLWEKVLLDYAYVCIILEDGSTEYVSIGEGPSIENSSNSIRYRGTFLEQGTEAYVSNYLKLAYPSIINAITRMSVRKHKLWSIKKQESEEEFKYNFDIPLVLGIAVRSLYDNKINEQSMPTILSCIQALTRIVSSSQFLSLNYAPGVIYELFLLLVRVQSRDLRLQYACLKLFNTIMNEIDISLFGKNDQISTQAIVTTCIEVCLKPLRIHFPILFEKDSEQEKSISISKEQLRLVRQCMSCMKSIVQRFNQSINSASLVTILYSLCRVIQYTKSSSGLEVAAMVLQLEIQSSSMSTLDETAVWIVAFESAIQNLSLRVKHLKLTSSLEVELLFIYLACAHKSMNIGTNESQLIQLAAIHESVLANFRNVLADSECLKSSNHVRKVSWILHGLQNGLLRLAKSNYSDLAMFYMSQLSGCICMYLLQLFESGRITNNQFEKANIGSPIIDEEEEAELILAVVPAGLNILLAGYSLIDVSKRTSYLYVMVPLLLSLFRTVRNRSTISPSDCKKTLEKLHKLAVQCMERFAQSTEQFTAVIRSLPPNIVQEIQQEIKRGKEKETRLATKSIPKHQKLQINFEAYVKK